MRNKNIKNAMVCLTAFVFLCTTFLPTVHSQLGTGISIQSQQNTTTKNPVQDVENTYLPKNSDSTSRTSKPGSPLPFDNDPPNVHLPTSQVTLKVFSSTTSYFRTLLSNVPSGYEVHNGNYTGWCSDNAHTINLNTAYQVILYSSYNTSLPTHLVHQNWSKVNYILNHKVGSDWHQVEYSILYILNFGNQGLNTNGWSMVNASILYGGSYVPNGGDIIAIIADAGTTVQRTIFELTVPTYSLTVTITGQGNVTKNPNQTSYTYSQNVLLTAVPSAGWSFSQWGGNLSGSTNPAVISMTGNKTVTATFSQNVYTLTITVNPTAGGSVAAVPSPPYHYGDVVTLTATANPGYAFDHWSGNASGSSSITTVTMNGNKSVTAHFTQNVYTLTITVNPTAGGSVAAVPSPPYHYGDVVTLTASANIGYKFDHWSGNASGTSSVTTVTMNGNKSVTAHFTQRVYTLTITINPTAGGSVAAVPSPPYHYGDVVTLTATANVGYRFDHWSGNASGTSSITTVTMNGNKSVTAHFTQKVYTLTITVNPTAGGSVAAVPSPPYHYGDVVTLTATANPGYTFDHWSGNASGSSSVTTVTMNGNKSVMAHFIQSAYTLTITVNPAAGGSVTADPGPPYYYNDTVTLTATANPGYAFDHWSGDASGSSTVTTVTMNGNKSVTAHFTQKQYTLTITIEGHGTVLKDPYQTTYPYNTVVELTAVPDTNWVFSSWSGDLTGDQNPDTITMTGNKTVTAHFIQAEDTTPPVVEIAAPGNAIYFMNKEIIPFKTPIVILSFTIGVNASDNGSGVNRVEFYIDGVLKENDTSKPYTCDWKDFRSGKRTIKAVAYDNAGNSASTELQVFKWRLHPVLLLILLVLGMILDSWDSPWQT